MNPNFGSMVALISRRSQHMHIKYMFIVQRYGLMFIVQRYGLMPAGVFAPRIWSLTSHRLAGSDPEGRAAKPSADQIVEAAAPGDRTQRRTSARNERSPACSS